MKYIYRLKIIFISIFVYENKDYLFNIQSKDYFLYAVYCLVNSLGSILLTNNYTDNISIVVSYISGVMCVFLLLHDTWSLNIRKYKVIYW